MTVTFNAPSFFVIVFAGFFGFFVFLVSRRVHTERRVLSVEQQPWLEDRAGYWWAPVASVGYVRIGYAGQIECRQREEIDERIGIKRVMASG
jgi:hypothetical protein